jgi:hypothetical protein
MFKAESSEHNPMRKFLSFSFLSPPIHDLRVGLPQFMRGLPSHALKAPDSCQPRQAL